MSRQELNRRQRANRFVGRSSQLTAFRDNLARDPQAEDCHYFFHVHGNAGVGKTTLVRQWEAAARAQQAATVYIDDDVHSVIEAMETISAQLQRQGAALKRFDELLATYRQRRHEAESAPAPATPAATGSGSRPPSAVSTAVAAAGLAGLGMVPGMGPVAGAMDRQNLAQLTDRAWSLAGARFRSHDDAKLVVSPLQVLTPTFLDDLGKVAERRTWVVLFIDVFEVTSPVIGEWLRDVLTTDRYGELEANIIAVLSGQGRLDPAVWADSRAVIQDVPLDVFSKEEARELLARHSVTNEPIVELVLELTGRLPVLVDLLAQARPQSADDVSDPSETAVDRFLKWITDTALRDSALACALPLQLDEDIYRATAPEGAADAYAWLCGLAFVSGQVGRARYHDVVRAPMLRLQRTRSATRWRQQHEHLAATYRRRRETREVALDGHETDTDWLESRLNETYHMLCADPLRAWPEALADLVDACDQDIAVVRRWAQTLMLAGRDTDDPLLLRWGPRVQQAAEQEAGTIAVLGCLLGAPELAPATRALAHALRGRDYRLAGAYDQALTDYAAALDLTPDLARAHYGRGETYRLTGRHAEALTNLNQTLELAPTESEYLLCRALIHEALEDDDAALADFNRAVELDPTEVWIIANRAAFHIGGGRYGDAAIDLTRAIELNPDHVGNLTARGHIYRTMNRNEDALTDLTRAIELNADNGWALAIRGEVHHSMERYDDALTDLTRAIELNQESALAYRGQTYHSMGRYDDALTDLSRAIELNQESAWIVASRGHTYHAMGRYGDALTDLDRAIELNPNDALNIADRGLTYRQMNDYSDALTDLDRAIELKPDEGWFFAIRGETHHLTGNYEDALTDLTRAIELKPDEGWFFATRGETHHLTGNYEDALTDLTRAIELNPNQELALANRGVLYREIGRYEDALIDLLRAVKFNPDLAWCHYHIAIAMHVLSRAGAEEHWQIATEYFEANITSGAYSVTDAKGNLLVMRCGASDWQRAAEELQQFLVSGPRIPRIREALNDLRDIEVSLALDSVALRPLLEKLETAIEAAGVPHP
ncbi:tetratricopeptide repeat protein [Streptomyces fuscigenes]|uniref:tetratricopeptide repeat protein n=1 Tax=Streptomyces fuscigenes TaxID=1528880 RepID=UPI001F3BC105|nr:tetratricopeptide repeat protein [Streptomyces fuscigenes]MCF3960486.1 tetratricopeptide repeat protein [Streptomyces fuscigenes]